MSTQNTPASNELPPTKKKRGRFFTFWAVFFATGAGSGYCPIAPGTAGSVVAVLLFLPLSTLHWKFQLVAILAVTLVGLWASARMLAKTGIEDDCRIVIDEVAGMWIALFALPRGWVLFVIAFFLFRVLDIIKIFPANWADRRLKGASGVMLDDVISGIYAAAIVHALNRLWGLF